MRRFLTLIALFVSAFGNAPGESPQLSVRYFQPGSSDDARLLAADRSGNLLLVVQPADADKYRALKLSANGARRGALDLFDFLAARPAAAAADPQGNLIVVGTADDPSAFPAVAPLFRPTTGPAAFVMKIDSGLSRILFATLLPGPSEANAVTTDAAGNIFVAGDTHSQSFPLTAGVYHTKYPGAFVTVLSPQGERILYSTYVDGTKGYCGGGPGPAVPCSGGGSSVTAIAVDASGAIFLAGTTASTDLPATAGALASHCVCGADSAAGFAAKLAPGATRLEWLTYVNPISTSPFLSLDITAAALDSAGNLVLAGQAPDFATTAGVIQPEVFFSYPRGFVAKLNAQGAAMVWATYFGEPGPYSIALDSGDDVWLTGSSELRNLPPLTGTPELGESFIARISADARTLKDLYLGAGGTALVRTPNNRIAAAGGRAIWIETATTGPSLLLTANAASGRVTGLASPSELLSLYGNGIGPANPLAGEVRNGAYTTSLGGYQVLFNGTPAPLLYAGPSQINTIVPRMAGFSASVHVQIAGGGNRIDGPTLAMRSAEPYVFQNPDTGLSVALNGDGTLNTPATPAQPGSIVTIFASGCGARPGVDGAIVPSGTATAVPGIEVVESSLASSGTVRELVSATDAPGFVTGVVQIRFRLPATAGSTSTYSFYLRAAGIAGSAGSAAAIAVGP